MRNRIAALVAVGLLSAAAVVAVQRSRTEPAKSRPAAASPSPAAPPTLYGPVAGTPPTLASLTPRPAIHLTGADLASRFPAFGHVPYPQSGFDPLTLPFRYADPDHVGEAAEANALAFLLADDLDWAPGDYSARHAYFVFERGADVMRPLAHGYDPATISALIGRWRTTHAVGGVLRRTAAGYAGTLEVYARDGSVAFTKDYANARPYAELSGDMAVDAIGFFGPPPTAELAAFLHQPRCARPASIARLGSAAFLPRRQAFDIYAQILRDDPTFAQVRYWYANQLGWATDGGAADEQRQIGQSLRDRLTPMAVAGFDADACPDRELSAAFPAWAERATRLAGGPDAPLSADLAIRAANRTREPDPAVVRRAVAVAARYPNRAPLLNDLAEALQWSDACDPELSASVAVAGWNSRFADPTGNWEPERNYVAYAADLMGRPDLACGVRQTVAENPRSGVHVLNSVRSLCNAGRYADAVAAFADADLNVTDPLAMEAAQWAALAAVTAGDADELASLRDRWRGSFDSSGLSALLDGRSAAIDLAALERQVMARQAEPGLDPRLALAAELDLARGQRFFRKVVWDLMCLEPDARLYWPLYDAYERQRPSPYGQAFYITLAGLFPDDPWVKGASDRWVARGRPGAIALAAGLSSARAALADYPPAEVPTVDLSRRAAARNAVPLAAGPFVVASLVDGLGRDGDRAGARELALRFRQLAVDCGDRDVSGFAASLVRQTR